MNAFERYFVHFFGICMIIYLIYLLLMKIDKSELLVPSFVIIMFICVLLFSGLMALGYSRASKISTVVIKSDNVNEDEMKLHEIITTQFKRNMVLEEGSKTEYRMKNKYSAWLTNSITVEKKEKEIYVCAPEYYIETLKKKFTTRLFG